MKYLALVLLLFAACAPISPRSRSIPQVPQAGCSRWNTLPMHVYLDEGAEDLHGALEEAMRAWNNAIGRQVFVWTTGDEPIDVMIIKGETFRSTEPGYTVSECFGNKLYHAIHMRSDTDGLTAVIFGAHELGHALGLSHSTYTQSVMHWILSPQLMGDWDDDHEPQFYVITREDIDAVNALHPAQ